MQPKTKREKWLTDECTCELSELGARVLEILREHYPQGERGAQGHRRPFVDTEAALRIIESARSLGLLGNEAQP